jgi:hypothetical protein
MDETILAPWRDAALILLAIEAMLIAVVPLVVTFYLVKGVRAVKRWVRPLLVNAQLWALRIQRGTTRTMDAAASVPITIGSRATLVSATTRGVVNFLLGK